MRLGGNRRWVPLFIERLEKSKHLKTLTVFFFT